MNEFEALLLLTHLPRLGPIKIRFLIQQYGSAAAAVEAPTSDLVDFFTPELLAAWETRFKRTDWQHTLELAEQMSIQIITYQDPIYPKRLLEIPDHPILLYVKGHLKPEDQQCLAMIGTREASPYGIRMTKEIARELAQAGFTIVSGLARGIDAAAHEGALEKGITIAVLGSGLGHIYPREHILLVEAIAEKGAVISEFPIDTPPDRQLFPQRNRIVSGMTRGTLLMEAPNNSGAMLTVEKAIGQGRPIFVLPGPADQGSFKGNHDLIKSRRGELIENSKDVIMFYSDLFNPFSLKHSIQSNAPLEQEGKFSRCQSKNVFE